MTQFNIEIVSDTVCPWCYIGKKKLEKAIAEYLEKHPGSQDTFALTWKPYYLSPDAPETGVDKKALYKSKFGDERAQQMFARVAQAGASVGIAFKFGGRTGNTRASHRLLQLARSHSPAAQTRLADQLFAAYFEHEQDITSPAVLTAAAMRAGLDEREVADWLASDRGGQTVDDEVLEARRARISGVPNFTVNGRYEVGGAQDPDVFLGVFEKIRAAEARGD